MCLPIVQLRARVTRLRFETAVLLVGKRVILFKLHDNRVVNVSSCKDNTNVYLHVDFQ
jgi:hypothetical protein